MDPLTLMFLASGQNPGGAATPLLNPGASIGAAPTGATVPNPLAPTGQTAPGSGPDLGKVLSGIQAPQGDAPKFSGGVSGSGLPYLQKMEDITNPFLQSIAGGRPAALPTLGSLLSQAGGR